MALDVDLVGRTNHQYPRLFRIGEGDSELGQNKRSVSRQFIFPGLIGGEEVLGTPGFEFLVLPTPFDAYFLEHDLVQPFDVGADQGVLTVSTKGFQSVLAALGKELVILEQMLVS